MNDAKDLYGIKADDGNKGVEVQRVTVIIKIRMAKTLRITKQTNIRRRVLCMILESFYTIGKKR